MAKQSVEDKWGENKSNKHTFAIIPIIKRDKVFNFFYVIMQINKNKAAKQSSHIFVDYSKLFEYFIDKVMMLKYLAN